MRIGIVASTRFPISEPFAGGLEKHTHDLAVGLEQRGHEVTVFAAEDDNGQLHVEPVCDERCDIQPEASDDLDDPRAVPQPFMRIHHAYLHLMLHLSHTDLDLVQNSSLHYLPIGMAPLLAVPFVTTLHTPPTSWLRSALAAHRYPNRSHYIAVSHTNARSWSEHVDVTAVIPNGVDLERWPYREEGDPDLVVWSGRLVPEKGAHFAVEAAHAAGKRIVLAGPTNGNRYAEDQVLSRLHDRDEYAGHLDQDELAELVAGAGVFVCTPCWEEPFGLVVAEALACGTPVAAFDRGAMREVVDDETGVLAPPADIHGLAAAIGRAQALDRTACRARAESRFSIDAMLDSYIELYAGIRGR